MESRSNRPRPTSPILAGTALAALAACAAPAREDERGPIDTDRPGFLFSPTLVPPGTFQVEAGTPLVALHDSGGTDGALLSTPVQVRYGLAPALELRVGSSGYNRLETGSGPDVDGLGDVEVGAKVPLALPFAQDAAALVAGLRLPVGEAPFEADGASPSLNAVSSWALDERTTLTTLLGLSYLPVDGGPDPLTGSLASYVSRALGSGWKGALETIWLSANDASDAAYAGFWTTKLLGEALQLDASLHRGLNDDSSDWLLGVGLAWRP